MLGRELLRATMDGRELLFIYFKFYSSVVPETGAAEA